MCKSRATHRDVQHAMLCAMWYKWRAQLLSLAGFKSHLFEILLAESLTDEGGEETGEPGENPWQRASENAKPLATSFRKCHIILEPEDSSPERDSNLQSSIGGRLGK